MLTPLRGESMAPKTETGVPHSAFSMVTRLRRETMAHGVDCYFGFRFCQRNHTIVA